jgi:nucleoside-diphosphate-sugar epimerase
VVFASSTSVYGQTNGRWVDEDSPTEPADESGRVALEAERTARALDPGVTIVRYAGLYGPGRIIGRTGLERGEPIPGDPERYLNLIHVEDAAALAVAALDRGRAGRVYCASDDRPLPRRAYYSLVAKALSALAPRFTDGPSVGRDKPSDDANKRVLNHRIKAELGVSLAYPDVATGITASLEQERAGP